MQCTGDPNDLDSDNNVNLIDEVKLVSPYACLSIIVMTLVLLGRQSLTTFLLYSNIVQLSNNLLHLKISGVCMHIECQYRIVSVLRSLINCTAKPLLKKNPVVASQATLELQ